MSTESISKYKGVAQNVNDSIRTNETSLNYLEEQIDRLTDALVSVNADPIEMQGAYEEERAKLQHEIQHKEALLNETLEELKKAEEQHQRELDLLQERSRVEKDSLVTQLRTSQAELMEHYSRVDLMEGETERLEWELSRAEEKYKLQNENLIEQNNALMHALQDEQNRSRDVIEDLERSLQTVASRNGAPDFNEDLDNVTSENFKPNSESSPIKEKLTIGKTALEIMKTMKTSIRDLGIQNEELIQIMDELEKAIIRESAVSKRHQRKCTELGTQLEELQASRPTRRELENVEFDLVESRRKHDASEQRIGELEKVLGTTLSKHQTLVAELNKTIDCQDKQIDELKKKNFYPKLMDDMKKENSKLKEEIKKLNNLVKASPSRKVGNLKNKFEEQLQQDQQETAATRAAADAANAQVFEKMELIHREEVNHLKGKLVILEKKLNQSLEENAHLNQELNDAIEQLDDNSFNYENVIQDLKAKLDGSILDNTSDIAVNESVTELRKHLESEKLRNEKLASMLADYETSKTDDASLPPPPPPPVSLLPPPDIVVSSPPPHPASPPETVKPSITPKPNSIKAMSAKIAEIRKEKDEKEASLAEATREMSELKENLAEYEKRVATQQSEIAKLKMAVERGISVSVTPIPPEVDILEQELEDSLHDKKHLEETIDIISEEHEAQIKAFNSRIASLEQELESALHSAAADPTTLQDELTMERQTRVSLEKRIEELEFELSEKNPTKESEDSLNNVLQDLDEAEKICEQLMIDKDSSPAESSKLKKLLKEKDRAIEKLEKENETLKTEVEQLNTEFADISTEIAEADQQYSQRIENLQKQIENNQEDHEVAVKDLQEEVEMLQEVLEEEKNSEVLKRLETENAYLAEECKSLTDRLASDILSKISPEDDRVHVISEMKEHYEKSHDRLKTELELKTQKISDLQEDLERMNTNYTRKIASIKESQDIKDEHHKLKIEEHLLTNESAKKELEQLKKISKKYEENLADKNVEFNEVVTKLLNLENLIELQQDNLLAKDEEIVGINRQLSNLKAELDIAQQRHNILREESITLDILENSLNEVSVHEKQQESTIAKLEHQLERTLSDLKRAEKERDELRTIKRGKEDKPRDTFRGLKKTIGDLESQVEDLQEQEEILSEQIKELQTKNSDLETKVLEQDEKEEEMKEKNREANTNKINDILSQQDRTKHELVAKNVELQNKYDALMERFCDLEDENSSLLEDIDTNFKSHTQAIKALESEIKSLKAVVAEGEEAVLKNEEIINEANAKNLADSQNFFEQRKQMEKKLTDLKTRLMEYEGGDAMRRTSSVHSVWLEDTASLNQVIGEKDKQIRDLRDSLKRSSLASESLKGSCMDLNFNSPSLGSIPPPSEIEIEGGYSDTIDNYKKQISELQTLAEKKDDEYRKLYHKFRSELDKQTMDSNVYNTHIKKLQNMATLFEQQADKLASENKVMTEKTSKGITDVNESLTNLTDELALESERTNEVLGELELLKDEINLIKDDVADNRYEASALESTLDKVLLLEDNVQMTVEEHQCSLDHYQLLLQTTQQQMELVADELRSATRLHAQHPVQDYLPQILEILQEKVTLVAEKLTETKNEVTSSRFRGSQNGKSVRENEIVIEQAQQRCKKYEDEIDSIKSMLSRHDVPADSAQFIQVTEELQEISNEMVDLKDLLSLKKSTSPFQDEPVSCSPPRLEQRSTGAAAVRAPPVVRGLESHEYETMNNNSGSVLERPVSLAEIDGLELITHDLRHQLREKTNECDALREENENMGKSMRDLQTVFGQMLSEKSVQMDTLNDTISAEKEVLETKLSQLSEVIEHKEQSKSKLQKTLSFEQGRVQQLKEDLDTTYEKTFEHLKEYEGRVSTITERLNLQQQQVKAKLNSCETEIDELKDQVRDNKQLLLERDMALEEIETNHRKELRSRQRLLKKAQEESSRYQQELEELKKSFSQSHGSLDLQLTQYSDVMTKFKNEISEEKEAFQTSLQKLNYLVEDRTQKIKEYEKIVSELQSSLSAAQEDIRKQNALNETLAKEKSQLKLSLLSQKSSKPTIGDNQKEDEIQLYKNKMSKAEQQVKKLKQMTEDIKFRYESQLSTRADELLTVNMKLEKVELELMSKIEQNNAIQNEVKALKVEIEAAGSDNQVKDLEQKLAAKQYEVEDTLHRMQRYQRETQALKDVLSSYQTNAADNDIAHKISEYETTIADYEVQVTMLKKNISDLHTQLHNTYDERQKVIEKAQDQISVYQRRLEQMHDRVEESKQSAKKEADSFNDTKQHLQHQVALLEDQIRDTQSGGEGYALRQKITKLERQLAHQKQLSSDKDIQQRFEMAVKRADHLQEQVDTMRKTNKRIQKTVEDLWAENTQLLKELNSTGVDEKVKKRGSKTSGATNPGVHKKKAASIPNVIESAEI